MDTDGTHDLLISSRVTDYDVGVAPPAWLWVGSDILR